MNYSGFNNYKKVEVETNDPIKLIIMLFEGAISFTEKAKLKMQEGIMNEKGILISKTLAIVSELQGSLNLEKGGEVAANMDRIYTYVRDRLIEGNQKNDVTLLDEVLNHLRILKSAWDKAQTKATTENAGTQTLKAVPDQPAARYTPVQQSPQPGAPQSTPANRSNEDAATRPAIEIVG